MDRTLSFQGSQAISEDHFLGDLLKIGKAAADAKFSDNVLVRSIDKWKGIWQSMGQQFSKGNPFYDALDKNQVNYGQFPKVRIGKDYADKFQALHNAIIDTFINMGRADLAADYGRQIQANPKGVPAEAYAYATTLAKGASNPIAMKNDAVKYDMLVPFMPLMKQGLQAKGIAAPANIQDLTEVFYKTFVSGNKEFPQLNFDGMTTTQRMQSNLDDSLIQATVVYLKSLADRKLAGEELPRTMDALASGTLKVQDKLMGAAKDEAAKQVGLKLFNNPWLIAGAVVVVIVLIVLVIKK